LADGREKLASCFVRQEPGMEFVKVLPIIIQGSNSPKAKKETNDMTFFFDFWDLYAKKFHVNILVKLAPDIINEHLFVLKLLSKLFCTYSLAWYFFFFGAKKSVQKLLVK
jgi:hypothetical protein